MPTLDLAIQVATLISVIVGFAGLIMSIRGNRKQINAQILISYAERYERIMDCYPENAFGARLSVEQCLPPESTQLTLAVLKYLNLCSEEYYLWKSNYIDTKMWYIWEDELKRMIGSKLVEREWTKLKEEFISYPEFTAYIQDVMASKVTVNVESD